MMGGPRLVRVAERHARSYVAMLDDYARVGEPYGYNHPLASVETARRDFAAFVHALDAEAAGEDRPPDAARQITYVLECGDTVLGEFRFRPTISEPYDASSGHAGYNISPAWRGRGYATQGLTLLLVEARAWKLPGLLLTVSEDNTASRRTIEKNGGILLGSAADGDDLELAYWLPVPVAD